MADDFRSLAGHLAGLIPATIGWTSEQFWDATPAELAAILGVLGGNIFHGPRAEPLSKTQLEQLKDTLDHG